MYSSFDRVIKAELDLPPTAQRTALEVEEEEEEEK